MHYLLPVTCFASVATLLPFHLCLPLAAREGRKDNMCLPGSSVHGALQARVGCHVFLQGIFPTHPGIKPASLTVSCVGRRVLYHSCHMGSPRGMNEQKVPFLSLLCARFRLDRYPARLSVGCSSHSQRILIPSRLLSTHASPTCSSTPRTLFQTVIMNFSKLSGLP